MFHYESVGNNIEFSNLLLEEGKILSGLQHRYIALRNILSHLLHRTSNFIIDGEFTQKFLQVFGTTLPSEIENDFYESVFKTEQILGRTGYLSFDLDEQGKYIFESGDYDYSKLIQIIDKLIKYFQDNFTELLDEVGEEKTRILLISSGEIDTNQFIFPHVIHTTTPDKVLDEIGNTEYILRLHPNHVFGPDYILKLLSGFNKRGVKCVTGNRVSLVKGAKGKFSNFAFKRGDYEKEGKGIFQYALRSVGTEYFTS